ncbi:MAG: energy transducer TonB [Burkholderiales bacterium]|nr:energy transducer TonB [Burkholderiales bacterium]
MKHRSFSRSVLAALLPICIVFCAVAGTPKVVKKVPPEFPAEAQRQSISSGTVTAKVSIEPDGKVSNVEILQAQPKRVFDRAVIDALIEWRFEPSGEKQTSEIKLVFKNDDE